MTNTQNYKNTHKYSNRKSMNGAPLQANEVLVPYWIQEDSEFQKGDIIKENCATFHIAGVSFPVCFIPIDESSFADYMQFFWKEIRAYLKKICTGRCIIGYQTNGIPICCPNSNSCTGCPQNGRLERFNPHNETYKVFSLDQLMDEDGFDITDPNQQDPETVICEKALSTDDYYEIVITQLEKDNPRYAQIVRLSKQRIPAEEICGQIGLKASRGYQEMNNAFDACCDILNLSCYKKKK